MQCGYGRKASLPQSAIRLMSITLRRYPVIERQLDHRADAPRRLNSRVWLFSSFTARSCTEPILRAS
jgi:hypothetical protein